MFKKLSKFFSLFDATEFLTYFDDLVFSESESESDDESDDDESDDDDDEYNLIVIFRH